jgi:predicted alpha/beta-fold hydrolase
LETDHLEISVDFLVLTTSVDFKNMPIIQSNYHPKGWLKFGHLQTIYPSFFRKVDFGFDERQRITLDDGDFLDIDWKKQGSNRLVVLCHGLEGSSDSSYILGMSKTFFEQSFDVAALNYRSCSGEMNLSMRFYHHGATDDLHEVMELSKGYEEVHLVGFSLGGNLVLKYCGESTFEKPKNLKKVVAFSVPLDLEDCVREIHKFKNQIYVQNFLITLKRKVKAKNKAIPELNTQPLKKIKSLLDFDQHYTAPIHGFNDAWDYYQKVQSKQFLKDITIPTLIINALDDPMLGEGCYPRTSEHEKENIQFMYPKYGGHCGFINKNDSMYWSEEVALEFISNQ